MGAEKKQKWFGKKQLWVTIFAGVMFLLSAAVAAGNANTVLPFFAEVRGWNYPSMMAFMNVGMYAQLICIVIFAHLATKIGAKKIIFAGLILGGISAIIFGTTTSQAVFNFVLVLNFIAAAAYQASSINIIINAWFPTKKGIILGWATMGLVLADIIWVPFAPNLFAKIGSSQTMIIVGIVFFIFAMLCLLTIKDIPEEAGAYPDGDPESHEKMDEVARAFREYKSPFTIGRMLRSRQTWQIMFGWGLPWMCAISVMSQFVPHAVSLGYAPGLATKMLAIGAVFALIGSWLFGFIDQKLGTKKASQIMIGVMFLMLICVLLQPYSPVFLWVSVIGVEATVGGVANLVPSMIGTLYGRWDFAAANRVITPLVMVVTNLGVTAVAIILLRGLSYTSLYTADCVFAAIAFVIVSTMKDTFIGKKDVQ